ncbi:MULTISPECIES: hypothetical protein [Actinomadura]|uniref:Transcriptional regulator n=1 Tax=Actinomadura yumaensis TaxID=111807 RepID=A0ABW2CU47_9ACTN|nr:hypothetical protein [Actinomadura sp. J1-007]MWK39553.1 hypothetical protein [Actinomadura sp. J1-007]
MAVEIRNAAEYPHKMPTTRSLARNIERWEDGTVVRISERYRILYCHVFGMSMDDLFGDGPDRAAPPPPSEGDAEAIGMMLAALMTSDRRFGGARIRRQATDYLSDVIEPRLHGPAPDEVRRRLFSVATEFVMRVAAMHLDADQASMAVSLLGRASSMAAESQDITLTAWTLSRRGEHEMHHAALAVRPAQKHAFIQQALAYTEGAAGVARAAPPIGRAFLTTKHALAWSMAGDRAQTQRVLGRVWDAYEAAGTAEEPHWMGPYGLGHLRHEEGRCYVNLGMGRDAVRAAEASLAERTEVRPRAFSLGILAIGHAQSLDVEQACATAHEFLQLASQVSSRRICIRTREVLDALAPYQNEPMVEDVQEAARPVLEVCGR